MSREALITSKTIKNKNDFLAFLEALEKDAADNKENWVNRIVESYLESVRAWAGDCSDAARDELSWNRPSRALAALLFYSGKICE